MTITSKKVYNGGVWKDITAGWVYQSGWKPIIQYSTYSSTGSPAGWKSAPLEIPAAPVLQNAVNSVGVTPNTFKYTAGGGESNILRSGEFIIFGNIRLEMQADGNLVGKKNTTTGLDGTAVFSTHTFSPTGQAGTYYFEAASDGNYYIKNGSGVAVGGVASGIGASGRIWSTGGLKTYLEQGGSGTLTMAGSRIVIQKDMHIVLVWYTAPGAAASGVGIGLWDDFYEYGILKKSAAHPFLPYYPDNAAPPGVGDTTFKLYTYSSSTATKGSLIGTETGDWGTRLRSTAPLDPAKPYMTYEIAAVSIGQVEGPRTTFKWKLGSAAVAAVPATYGWGTSSGYRWADDYFYASLGSGTTAAPGYSVNSVLSPSGSFRAYQEDSAALQPANAYGQSRWIGNGTWSGFPSASLPAPSVNIHADARRKITRVKVVYDQGFEGSVNSTSYADGFAVWDLDTYGGWKESTTGEVEWSGLGIDVGAGLAIVIRCIRGAIILGSQAVSTSGFLVGKCQISLIYIDSQLWTQLTAGSSGIAAIDGTTW